MPKIIVANKNNTKTKNGTLSCSASSLVAAAVMTSTNVGAQQIYSNIRVL